MLGAAVVLAACGTPSPTAAPTQAVAVTPVASDVAAGLPSHGRQDTFEEAYQAALPHAQTWNANAVLYQVAPTAFMAANLGQPVAETPGWFFMFRDPASPVEYFVMIVDGALYGATEAQAIVVGEARYALQPIDLAAVKVDDVSVMQQFMANGGQDYVSLHPNFAPDFQLVHVQGQPNPVWSLFDGSDLEAPALIHVDATTGAVTTDPIPAPVS